MKKFLLVLVLVIGSLFIGACSDDDTEENDVDLHEPSEKPAEPKDTPPTEDEGVDVDVEETPPNEDEGVDVDVEEEEEEGSDTNG